MGALNFSKQKQMVAAKGIAYCLSMSNRRRKHNTYQGLYNKNGEFQRIYILG